jgi:hypothetical protein
MHIPYTPYGCYGLISATSEPFDQSQRTDIVHLPESTKVGVRFCKPGKRQCHSAKHDTEDSDIFISSQPTVNRQTNTYCRAQ